MSTTGTGLDTRKRIIYEVNNIKKSNYYCDPNNIVMIEYCEIADMFGEEMLIAFSIPARHGETRSIRNSNYQPTIFVFSHFTNEDRHAISLLLSQLENKYNLRTLESCEHSGWFEFRLSSKVGSN